VKSPEPNLKRLFAPKSEIGKGDDELSTLSDITVLHIAGHVEAADECAVFLLLAMRRRDISWKGPQGSRQ
jgi:hypothetical protein